MDLPPKPDQVVAAAGNLAHSVLYGGVADLRPMPRMLIDDGPLREVYRYKPDPEAPAEGDPVLLVTPLAAPALCFDLRRGCSLVEHLVRGGRPTYLLEYGRVSFADRDLGLEHWVSEVLPAAVREVSADAGGRPVHLVGWSLGGIFAVLTAADAAGEGPDLPIASVTALGSPFDVAKVPLIAPLRPILDLTGGSSVLTRLYRTLGGVPVPAVRAAFQLVSAHKVATKPLVRLANLDDREHLAQIEAVERFSSQMTAYPGRTFGQLFHRVVRGNELRGGEVDLGDRVARLADVDVPVLIMAGNTDGIAPIAAVRHLKALLTGSPEVAFEIVPGGHLGMLTGRAARETTWIVLDEWLTEHEQVAA